MSRTSFTTFYNAIILITLISFTLPEASHSAQQDTTGTTKSDTKKNESSKNTTKAENQKGMACVTPNFEVNFIGKDILEITATTENIDTASFKVWLSEIPDFDEVTTNENESIKTKEYILEIRNGEGVVYITPKNIRLIKSEGRVTVHYEILGEKSKTCNDWNSGECVVIATDISRADLYTGMLFNLEKTGKVKGNLEVDFTTYTRHNAGLSTFGEFQYTSIGAIDSTTTGTNKFVNKFAEGGGVFNVLVGLMYHGIPFFDVKYQEWETPVISPFVGFGFRSFANEKAADFFAYPRIELGLDINLIQFNAGGLQNRSGYIDIGYSYDKFWTLDRQDSANTKIFDEPRRFFLRANLDFEVSNLILAAFISADIPATFSKTPMRLSFGLYAYTDIDKVAEFLAGFVNIFNAKTE